jgi:hypothetical protein
MNEAIIDGWFNYWTYNIPGVIPGLIWSFKLVLGPTADDHVDWKAKI